MQLLRRISVLLALAVCCGMQGALAQQPAPQPPESPETPEPALELEQPSPPVEPEDVERDRPRIYTRGTRDGLVTFGADVALAADESAEAVVAIFGSASSAGEVRDAVVSVFGNTRVTGRVGNEAAAVFGDNHIDGEVGGDAVAILGNLTLGPSAEIGGDVVVVGGRLARDPQAVIHGQIEEVAVGGTIGDFAWIKPWINKALLYGRPLALGDGMEWAWWMAFGFLAFYLLLAVLFSDSMTKCVETLEKHPGHSALAAILAVLLTPVLCVLLLVTVIGIPLVPFFVFGLLLATLFGKAVVFAAIGRRFTRFADAGPLTHVAVATLIGGLVVIALYLVPVFGFILYNITNILGLGVVVYTVILSMRARREERPRVVRAAAAPAAAAPIDGVAHMQAPGAEPATSFANTASAGSPSEAPQAEPSVAPAPLVAATLPRADFMIRMGALLIDTILVGVLVAILGIDDVTLLALAIYGAVMWKLKGTTIGGIVCNLQVVRLDGREINWDTAAVRALGCFLSLVVAFLGFLWIIFDDEKQGWHDKIAGTVVVRVPRGVSLV